MLKLMIPLVLALAAVAAACASASPDTASRESSLRITAGDGTEESFLDTKLDPPRDRVDFSWQTFDGTTKTLSDFGPGPIVLNFFASWCPPCIAEMPEFEAVSQVYGSNVRFIGLATTDSRERAMELVNETGVSYEVGADPNGKIFSQMGGLAMPTTVFIDANRLVTSVHTGQLSAEALTAKINEELIPQ